MNHYHNPVSQIISPKNSPSASGSLIMAGCIIAISGLSACVNSSVGFATPFMSITQVPPTPTIRQIRLIPDNTRLTDTPFAPNFETITPDPSATPTAMVEGPFNYGYSYNGRSLEAFRIGHGPTALALVGGIHGGYEWNTTSLVNEFLIYFIESQELIPSNVSLYFIPLANPDGAAAGTDRVHGRMNGNGVDLNRNWDFQWQPVATHGTSEVNAGDRPFSEPETIALRDFILERNIGTVIFFHSAMAEVYPGTGVETSNTFELAKWYAEQTGYRFAPEGIPGQITTGNSIDWLTTNGITAIEVELTNHTDLDWEINLKAILALLKWGIQD